METNPTKTTLLTSFFHTHDLKKSRVSVPILNTHQVPTKNRPQSTVRRKTLFSVVFRFVPTSQRKEAEANNQRRNSKNREISEIKHPLGCLLLLLFFLRHHELRLLSILLYVEKNPVAIGTMGGKTTCQRKLARLIDGKLKVLNLACRSL